MPEQPPDSVAVWAWATGKEVRSDNRGADSTWSYACPTPDTPCDCTPMVRRHSLPAFSSDAWLASVLRGLDAQGFWVNWQRVNETTTACYVWNLRTGASGRAASATPDDALLAACLEAMKGEAK